VELETTLLSLYYMHITCTGIPVLRFSPSSGPCRGGIWEAAKWLYPTQPFCSLIFSHASGPFLRGLMVIVNWSIRASVL
jgi:hypothetical protein